MDENKFGPAAAAFMEQLSDEFPAESALQAFGIIAAIDHGDGNSSVKFTFQGGDGNPVSVYMAWADRRSRPNHLETQLRIGIFGFRVNPVISWAASSGTSSCGQ
jgi:hypothetical protein